MAASALIIGYAVWALAFANPDVRLLLTPIVLSSAIVATMIEYFWRRDRHLPIVDVGVLCALITLVYAAVPTIFYIKSGLTWTVLSDKRLQTMNASPQDIASVLWLVTGYLAALCVIYGLFRGRGMPGPEVKINIPTEYGWALLGIVLVAMGYQVAIERIYDVDLNPSNKAIYGGATVHLPLFIGQITHNIIGIGRIAKIGLIVFAISRKNWLAAGVLAIWLLIELYSAATVMGGRTYVAILLIVVILSVHRIVRTIGPLLSITLAALLLAGLLAYGYHRDLGLNPDQIANAWSAVNEFQVLLANAIDISWAQDHGMIQDVPWTLKLSDLIMMIPQQLLPFRKIDPSEWFLEQFGFNGEGYGLMFGVVTQAKLGYGLAEIIARGAALGAVLAFIHRKCVQHVSSLTAFICYLWLCTSIYYTYRATTFYIATWAVYRVVPFVAMFWLLSRILAKVVGERGAQAVKS